MENCNWYWGSHGCSATPGHELPHVCLSSDPDDPPGYDGRCSEHDGLRARFRYVDGGGWTGWSHVPGFCNPTDRDGRPQLCGDPEHCADAAGWVEEG